MFANRVISDLTGKKMKKMMAKLVRNQEKIQVEGYRKSNDLLTQFNLEMPAFKDPDESGTMDNVKKCRQKFLIYSSEREKTNRSSGRISTSIISQISKDMN